LLPDPEELLASSAIGFLTRAFAMSKPVRSLGWTPWSLSCSIMTCSAGLISMCVYSRIIIFWLHMRIDSADAWMSFFVLPFRPGLSSACLTMALSTSLVSPTYATLWPSVSRSLVACSCETASRCASSSSVRLVFCPTSLNRYLVFSSMLVADSTSSSICTRVYPFPAPPSPVSAFLSSSSSSGASSATSLLSSL
jgi:hypothetical protein